MATSGSVEERGAAAAPSSASLAAKTGWLTADKATALLLGLLNIVVVGFGIVFWDSFTNVRDAVQALQRDVTEIKVAAATMNGKIDSSAAAVAGDLKLVNAKLDDMRAILAPVRTP